MDEDIDGDEDAATSELTPERRRELLERFAGWLKDVETPGWETPEATAEWVHRGRRIETGDPGTEAEAAQRELRRLERRAALREFAGSMKGKVIPEWESSESAAEWVRAQRQIGVDPWDECAERARKE